MGLSIKNHEVEQMIRSLATMRGISMTEAVKQALTAEIAREKAARDAAIADKIERMKAIVQKTADLPRLTEQTDDEILGYDENGLPV